MQRKMKKIFALGWMLVAALALTNCSKEETVAPEVEGQAFELFASTNGTRTTMADLKTSWVEKDAMNVWTANGDSYLDHGTFTISDVENGKFTGTLHASFDNTTANDWYVIYPYSSFGLMPVNSAEAGTWMFVGHGTPKQNGNNSQAHLSGSSAPLYGVATAVAGSETPVFQMHHLSTFVRVRVTNNTANPFSVASVYLTSENELTLAGKFYLDITGDAVVATPYEAKTEVTLTVNNGEEIAVGQQAEFYLPLAPIQFGEADEMLTVDITTTEGATISVEKTIPAGTKFAAGKLNTLKVEATEDNIEYPVVETETWTLLTDPDEMVDGQYIVVAKYDNSLISYLPSTTTSSAPVFSTAPEAFDLTSRTIEYAAIDAMVWNFAHIAENRWYITNSEGAYFYSTAANNGLRVGTTSQHAWAIDTHADNAAAFVFQSPTTSRFVGIYNAADWRCYSTYNASNYKGSSQLYLYYKGTVVAKTALATPVVTATAEGTTITATWAAIENAASYTVTFRNTTTDETVEKSVTETTCVAEELAPATEYEISVIAEPAEGSTTYKKSEAGVATATTGGEAAYTTIAEIKAAGIGTYNIKNATVVAVANNQYANSLITDGTGYLYVYATLGQNKGDIVTLTGVEITEYANQYQIGSIGGVTVIEEGTTVTHPTPEVISAADYETKSQTGNFEVGDYVQLDAVFTVSGNYLNFTVPGKTQKGSLMADTDYSAFNGQYVTVTGYVLYNTGTYYTVFATGMTEGSNYLYTEPATFEWAATATDAKVATVKADHTWSVTSKPEWLTVATDATSVTMTPSVNEVTEAREGKVVLTDELGATWSIDVKQAAAATAGEVVVNFISGDGAAQFSNNSAAGTNSATNGAITILHEKGSNNNAVRLDTPLRVYKGATLTLSGAKITKVEFTYASGYANGWDITTGSGSITTSGLVATYTGNGESTIKLSASGQNRLSKIVVTYTE